jgi:hypothetical protein
VSVQNCETYQQARRKNKQNKVVFARCMNIKQQKFDLFHLSTKEYSRKSINKIIKRIFQNFTRPLHSQLRNEANFEVLYTIYCNLGQFTLIIREVDYKKKCKLSQVTINHIQYIKISFITYNLIDKIMFNII